MLSCCLQTEENGWIIRGCDSKDEYPAEGLDSEGALFCQNYSERFFVKTRCHKKMISSDITYLVEESESSTV